MASQAATRAMSPLPPSARHSDVHCDNSAIHMHVRCARAPSPAAAPTTSCCCPARSAHGGHGFVAGTMDFAAVGEKRGEGGGLPRPHGLPGCHPHPATSTPPPPSPTTRVTAGIMDAKIPADAELSERCRGPSRLCSNAYRAAFTIHAIGRRTAAEAVVRSHCRVWPLPPRGGWGSSRGHLAS
jgi:hypothetical protein